MTVGVRVGVGVEVGAASAIGVGVGVGVFSGFDVGADWPAWTTSVQETKARNTAIPPTKVSLQIVA